MKMESQKYRKMLEMIYFSSPARLCLQSRRSTNLSGWMNHCKITTILLHQVMRLSHFLLEVQQGLLFLHQGEGKKINKMSANDVARIWKDKIRGKKFRRP